MSTYGQLTQGNTIVIFTSIENEDEINVFKNQIAIELNQYNVKVVLIKKETNDELITALRIKKFPSIIYYHEGKEVIGKKYILNTYESFEAIINEIKEFNS